MTIFSDQELDCLGGQRLARFATAHAGGAPHVVPVGFRLSEVRVLPGRVIGWGIEAPAFSSAGRRARTISRPGGER
jgi:hypothetical protein